jgi:hypothetical protein
MLLEADIFLFVRELSIISNWRHWHVVSLNERKLYKIF